MDLDIWSDLTNCSIFALQSKIQTLGAKPTEQMLGLLRQLKYTENAMFNGYDPYDEAPRSVGIRSDVEMVLLDLF